MSLLGHKQSFAILAAHRLLTAKAAFGANDVRLVLIPK